MLPILALVLLSNTQTAQADTGGYPNSNMPCEHAPYATSGTGYWCNNYDWGPKHTKTLGDPTTISSFGYSYRNCTDFVAWKLSTLGVSAPHYKGLGNANTWGTRAAQHSVINNAIPAVGSVAVSTAGKFGHVALVTAVAGNKITVIEYNLHRDGNFGTRTGTPANLTFTSFDHFEAFETTSPPPPTGWSKISTNGGAFMDHSCGIKKDGTAWCWGDDSFGVLGDNRSVRQSTVPVGIVGGGSWSAIGTAGWDTCGIRSDATAWCWGYNVQGEFGNNTTTESDVPTLAGGGGAWKLISDGNWDACGIKTNGTAWCWGTNVSGALGNNSTTDSHIPVAVIGGGNWSSLSTGQYATCGTKTDGTAWCWGSNHWGQLGNNSTTASSVPVAVSGGGTWSSISLNSAHSCGIKINGTAWCWGYNGDGELGNNSTSASSVPIAVSGGGTWSSLMTGQDATCGIKTDGTAWCWGDNSHGELGNNSSTGSLIPVAVTGTATWSAISPGLDATCAIKTDASAWCWGNNSYGELGNNSTTSSTVPVPVSQ